MESALAPGVGDTTVWDAMVDALQKALAFEARPDKFAEITRKLQELSDETLRFTQPIFPQKAALDLFVERSIESFPDFFGFCREDVELLHHLQRYAACFVAYKTGYFDDPNTTKRLRIKILPPKLASRTEITTSGDESTRTPATKSSRITILPPRSRPQTESTSGGESSRQPESMGNLLDSGKTAIETFLAGCHPPMSHLFEGFQRARITGEIHLQALAGRAEDDLREYITSSEIAIAQTALEVEALVQALVRKKSQM
ncbi:hypothetical protein MVEN_01045200 [Mycena venus]|uniref:Uncharacterized protein n=1 Tax=Mycena venus TaxID=2733690 RepID=A0A8H7CZY0_9AGAR|nr:hypothetical protein MVEN_01045200 [Mycena venus]